MTTSYAKFDTRPRRRISATASVDSAPFDAQNGALRTQLAPSVRIRRVHGQPLGYAGCLRARPSVKNTEDWYSSFDKKWRLFVARPRYSFELRIFNSTGGVMSLRVSPILFCFALACAAIEPVSAQQPGADVTSRVQAVQLQANQAPTAQTVSDDHPSAASGPKAAPVSNPVPLSTSSVKAGPSADLLKGARRAGYKIKAVKGATIFCKSQASLGSRFETESCIDQAQVSEILARAEDQRDKMEHRVGTPTNIK